MNSAQLRQTDVEKYLPNYYILDEEFTLQDRSTLATFITSCAILGVSALLFILPVNPTNNSLVSAKAALFSTGNITQDADMPQKSPLKTNRDAQHRPAFSTEKVRYDTSSFH